MRSVRRLCEKVVRGRLQELLSELIKEEEKRIKLFMLFLRRKIILLHTWVDIPLFLFLFPLCDFHVLHHIEVGEFEVWLTRQPVARRKNINADGSGLRGLPVWEALKAF